MFAIKYHGIIQPFGKTKKEFSEIFLDPHRRLGKLRPVAITPVSDITG